MCGWVGDAGGLEKVRMLGVGAAEGARKDAEYQSVG